MILYNSIQEFSSKITQNEAFRIEKKNTRAVFSRQAFNSIHFVRFFRMFLGSKKQISQWFDLKQFD